MQEISTPKKLFLKRKRPEDKISKDHEKPISLETEELTQKLKKIKLHFDWKHVCYYFTIY